MAETKPPGERQTRREPAESRQPVEQLQLPGAQQPWSADRQQAVLLELAGAEPLPTLAAAVAGYRQAKVRLWVTPVDSHYSDLLA